jgi:hypothetical protein
MSIATPIAITAGAVVLLSLGLIGLAQVMLVIACLCFAYLIGEEYLG